jgi:hypothetical protein
MPEQLPIGFEWLNDRQFKHIITDRVFSIFATNPVTRSEIAFGLARLVRDWRRDRLYRRVGCDIQRFRECQLKMRERGFLI